jgi:hypothetical protein
LDHKTEDGNATPRRRGCGRRTTVGAARRDGARVSMSSASFTSGA